MSSLALPNGILGARLRKLNERSRHFDVHSYGEKIKSGEEKRVLSSKQRPAKPCAVRVQRAGAAPRVTYIVTAVRLDHKWKCILQYFKSPR